jgi:hypothetical protein
MKSAIRHTKPSAGPNATGPHAPRRGAASGTGRVQRTWLRFWLRYRLDAYTRSLHTIAAQRENDFHAERLLHRAISATRSRLQSL